GRLDAARVRQFAATLFLPGEVREYFVCGPGDMIEQVSATLHELGVPSARVHAEHFTVATTAGDAARHGAQAPARAATAPAAGRAAGEAEVTILMDGRRRAFSMKMDDETVLAALPAAAPSVSGVQRELSEHSLRDGGRGCPPDVEQARAPERLQHRDAWRGARRTADAQGQRRPGAGDYRSRAGLLCRPGSQ